MKYNKVRLNKVVAVATTLFCLGTCNVTANAYVINQSEEELLSPKIVARETYWTGKLPTGYSVASNDKMIITVDSTENVFAAGAGIFMPTLNEIVVTQCSTVCVEDVTDVVEKDIVTDNNSKVTLNDKELDLMYKIVAAEAKGECYEGKVAVAEVILNRVHSSKFPDTIEEVIFAPKQFQPTRNGHLESAYVNLSASLQEEVRNAVHEALDGSNYTSGALFFRTQHYHEGRTPIKQIGNHYYSK